MALIGDANLFCDMRYGKIRLDEQLSCQLHAALHHIACRGLTGLFGEKTDKMVGMQMADGGKMFIGQRLCQMLVDVGQNIMDPAVLFG